MREEYDFSKMEGKKNPFVKDDRFQFQPFHVKLWRLRHFLIVPFQAVLAWILYRGGGGPADLPFRYCWGICVGDAYIRMKYTRTLEEMKERLGDKLNDD